MPAAHTLSTEELDLWGARFSAVLAETGHATNQATHGGADPAHNQAHLRRVLANARRIVRAEAATTAAAVGEAAGGSAPRLEVIEPAVWLHDCVVVPKDSPERAGASRLAAARAREILVALAYPEFWHEEIAYAIEAHSFSAGIAPRTPEAKIVQDADRLDALGAIGIARCFTVGGALGRALYAERDPACEKRPPDDGRHTLDHFYRKLFRLPETMQTAAGRAEAARRVALMRDYVAALLAEIGTAEHAGHAMQEGRADL